MTRPTEPLAVQRRIVIVFDICSSTTILEDLKRTDNLAVWRNVLISLRDFLLHASTYADTEPVIYKFIGDGWIILFPPETLKLNICNFLSALCAQYDVLHERLAHYLEHRVIPNGLTFGIDSGDLIRIEMNDQIEYLGRAINVATRLQDATKTRPGGPSYKALFSKTAFNSLRGRYEVRVTPAYVDLRNIVGGGRFHCFEYQVPFKVTESHYLGSGPRSDAQKRKLR